MERLDATPDGTRGGSREGVEAKCRGKVNKKPCASWMRAGWSLESSKHSGKVKQEKRGRKQKPSERKPEEHNKRGEQKLSK